MAKRLYRNDSEKVIGGVCAGLAEYFDIDVVIIRIIFVATALIWGTSILLYLILWIAIPRKSIINVPKPSAEDKTEAPDTTPPTQTQAETQKSNKYREVFAVILIIIGIFATLNNVVYWWSDKLALPILLITIGLLILLYPSGKQKETKKEGTLNDTL
jgi:phage shock protein PspC (stress-responsive transcriptional regulator)